MSYDLLHNKPTLFVPQNIRNLFFNIPHVRRFLRRLMNALILINVYKFIL